MSSDTPRRARSPSARERLLQAASQVFYGEGIHAVPVDRIIAEAGVTRATFYRHFAGKEDLVRAYLEARDQQIRVTVNDSARDLEDPDALLRAFVDGIDEDICQPGFRGCPFINAAAEYPDPTHPVRLVIAAHRTWFRETLEHLMTAIGHPEPESAARTLAMLRDGAMTTAYLDHPDTPEAARAHLKHAVDELLASRGSATRDH